MGKLIPFLFIALDGKSAVAHLRLRIPCHKLRGSRFSFRWSPVRIVIGSHGLIATVFYFKNYATGIQRQHGMPVPTISSTVQVSPNIARWVTVPRSSKFSTTKRPLNGNSSSKV